MDLNSRYFGYSNCNRILFYKYSTNCIDSKLAGVVKRPDVVTITNWGAPVIWKGTYDRQVLEKHYRRLNVTVGLAICTSGKFADQDLKELIQSANKHFMAGHPVIFYILMDDFSKLPHVELGPLRTMKLFTLHKENAWKDKDFMHMKNLDVYITKQIQHEVDFLFSMTANQIFRNDFGVETLGESVARLDPWWYFKDVRNFPYERKSKSEAFIPYGMGDFYYQRTLFGGTPLEVLTLIREYEKGVTHDTREGITSIYESHLNKYFFNP
ncbi:LOW QUALITY PROTEIN: putative glycosyltransferase 6 domain-containing protein 1 [Talpa occidentalis]|uniref:LOW QUALITY PROTEIN: putative glycosyltransferase 6 domain-containing protein 1 n=1 Tax=Talpa occidentalis TaxID=50954 RepID=UPI0023F974E9|nr:LOW QUALITY PROTEIN: putative glycosyltransferase 6 domain-containing protein 1 [Talpa occidentalis]